MQVDSDVQLPRLRSISQLWRCAALLAGLGVAALAVDIPLAAWAHRGAAPTLLYKICGLSEAMGHGAGIVMIAIIIAVLDPMHRAAVPRILVAALGSGILSNVLKLSLARTRPAHYLLSGSGLDTFGDWFPLLTNTSWTQSFPSSHAATAAGMAIVLSWLYPRGRWLFPAFAALACFQRMLEEAHYLSDVLWGAAVGCIFAPLCVYGSGLARVFDHYEASHSWRPDSPTDAAGTDAAAGEPHEHPRAA